MTSYILNKWTENQVHITSDGAVGWLMDDGEFRPLMSDALKELSDAGHIDQATVERTNKARAVYTERTLAEYRQAQLQRTPEQVAEQRAEARAAHGPGVKLVNVFTGESYTT